MGFVSGPVFIVNVCCWASTLKDTKNKKERDRFEGGSD